MRINLAKLLIFTTALSTIASMAFAQQTPIDVISFLVTNQSVPTGDFQKDQAAAAATRDTIVRSLLVNLASTPIATSSSGFVYRLDPDLGTMTRVSDTFGTFYVERATTSGRGRASFGASATATGYDRLDGLNLTDGTLITTANQFTDEAAPFDTESLTLKISARTLTLFGSYGVTDRLEVSAAVPFVDLHVEGSRVNVYRGQTFVQATGQANASGIADTALRAKYRLVSAGDTSVAAAVEVRLPTGNDANLLGAGSAAVRVLGIVSQEHGRIGVHANADLVRGGASAEFGGSGAVTFAASPHVTIAGELLARRLTDLREIVAVSEPHPTIPGVDTLRLVPGDVTPTLSSGVTGVKWNVHSTMVLSGQVLWRIGSGGLTAPFTPTVAVDYLF
ncbi:MAG TPA: hypothetical protein VGL62_08080 [Vicinamibacterales bacterium]